jgi:hypothetical protein
MIRKIGLVEYGKTIKIPILISINICLSIFYLFDLNIVHRIELCADCTCSKLKLHNNRCIKTISLKFIFLSNPPKDRKNH